MNVELGPTLEKLIAALKPYLARVELRVPAIWVRLGILTLVSVVAGFAVGRSANARAANFRAEVDRLAVMEAEIDQWSDSIQWPADEEQQRWAESRSMFERMAGTDARPLTLANELTRRGEEVGAMVRIQLVSMDELYLPAARNAGNWTVRPGETAFSVSIRGGWSEAIGFLGVLPPEVEVADMELSAVEGGVTMHLTLLSREVDPTG